MCFFWPASTAGKLPYHSVVLKRKKRSRRKKKSNNGPGSKPRESPNAEEGSTLDLAAHSSSAVPANTPPPPPAPPSDAHPVDPVVSDLSSTENDSSGSDSFGLKSCESVALDIRDVPGVSFVKDGEPGWTPVVSLSKRKREKRKERKKLLSLPGSTSSSSDSDLNLSSHSKYLVVDGSPGISTQNQVGTQWWTPIAARTRYKLKSAPKKSTKTPSIS